MIPVTVQDEVKELEAALSRHPPANPPTVFCIIKGIMFLPNRKPDLVQHGRQPVGGSLGIEVPAGEQAVAEAQDSLTVRDLKLLQVPQQNLGIVVQALMSNQDDVPSQLLQPLQEGHESIHQVKTLHFLPVSVQPAPAGVEVVGQGCLGVDIPPGPHKLVKCVFSPAVNSSDLYRSDGPVKACGLQVKEDNIGWDGVSCGPFACMTLGSS